MTVALVLSGQPGVGQPDAGPGLLTVAAAARAAGERVLICVGDDSLPEEVLARLLAAGGTAAFTGAAAANGGALVVDPPDLTALADAAEALARRRAAPAELSVLLGELGQRGVGVRVLDDGPDGDGAVTRWLVAPLARDVARWAAGRQLSPAALLGIALGLAVVAAAWFTEPAVRARVLASVALLAGFAMARAATQLTATERPGPAVAWLAPAVAILTEFAVLGTLAASAAHTTQNGLDGIFGHSLQNTNLTTWGGAGQAGLWRLAVAVMLLFGARRLAEECYAGLARASGRILPHPARKIAAQVITLPAGERIAVVAVTAICWGPRLTFLVLLAWGAIAAGYVLASQVAAAAKLDRAAGIGNDYRGDGTIAHRIGRVVRGQLPPLPPLLVGLLVTCDLIALGVASLPDVLIFGPVMAMLLAALGASHPHDGRLDWVVPALLLTGEGVFLAGLGFARHVWLPVIFALLAAVVLRHADLACRARSGRGIPYDRYGFGWDGRMLLAGFAAGLGFVPFAYVALAAWLWLLAALDFLGGWLAAR